MILNYLPLIVLVISIPFWFDYYSSYLALKDKGSSSELKIGLNKIIRKIWIIITIFILSAIIAAVF